MTKADLLKKHIIAVKELTEAGLLSYRLLLALMIYDKHESDVWTGEREPVKKLSIAFRYTRGHIHRILKTLKEKI